MHVLRNDLCILAANATWDRGTTPKCTRHGMAIQQHARSRVIYTFPFNCGDGKQIQVWHFYCRHCDPVRHEHEMIQVRKRTVEPVFDIALIEVDEALMPTGADSMMGSGFGSPRLFTP